MIRNRKEFKDNEILNDETEGEEKDPYHTYEHVYHIDPATVDIKYVNGDGHTLPAHVRVQLIDTNGNHFVFDRYLPLPLGPFPIQVISINIDYVRFQYTRTFEIEYKDLIRLLENPLSCRVTIKHWHDSECAHVEVVDKDDV